MSRSTQRFKSVQRLCFLSLLVMLAGLRAEKQEIRVGLIAPLSGESAIYGTDLVRIAELLVERFNGRGDIPYRLRLIPEDGHCGAGNAAMTAAKKLVEIDQVKFMLVACSAEVMQPGKFLEANQVVTIASSASVHEVRDLGEYIFRTYVDMGTGVESLATIIQARQDTPIAILTEEAAFTVAASRQLRDLLGSGVVASEDFASGSVDLRATILKVLQKKPKALYLSCSNPKTYQNLMSQLRQLGAQQQIYTYYMPRDSTSIAVLGIQQEGVIFIDTPDERKASSEYLQFLGDYSARYAEGPTQIFLHRTAYDAATILLHAIAQGGVDSSKVRAAVAAYKGQGALGFISFDSVGDIEGLKFEVHKIADGKVAPLS